MTAPPSPPGATAARLSRAALVVAAGWTLHDAVSAGAATAAGLAALVATGVLGGALVGAAALGLIGLGRVDAHITGSTRNVTMPATFVLGVLLLAIANELLGGPWISARPGIGVLRLVAFVACFVAPGLGLKALGRALARPRRRVMIGLLALPVLVLLATVDRLVLPRLYPAFHLGLRAGLVAGLLLLGWLLDDLVGPRLRRVMTVVAVVAIFGAIGAHLAGQLPGAEPVRRDLLLNRAPLAKTLLRILAPADAGSTGPVDQELLRRLQPRPPLAPARLDGAFPGRHDWSLLLVTVDTLRADHVSALGYPRRTTPRLDGLAAEGWTFEAAYTPYPSTILALASLFKGPYPTATDVYPLRSQLPLPADRFPAPTLTARFREAGFRTAAVCSFPADLVSRIRYVEAGFDTIDHRGTQTAEAGERVADLAIQRLHEAEGRQFLWVHLFDPHNPYLPHPGFDFSPRGVPSRAADPIDLYDGEIAYADHQLGRILDALRDTGRADRTVVVVHSDHGEELGDHGSYGHLTSLYEEQVRVPLVVRLPGGRAERVARPVELIDLTPTLTQLFGLAPLPDARGHSLLPLLIGGELEPPPPVALMQLRESRFGAGQVDAIRVEDWKLHHDRTSDTYRLFDLASDPREQSDLVATRPDDVARLQRWLTAARAVAEGRDPADPNDPVDLDDLAADPDASDADARVVRLLEEGRTADFRVAITAWLAREDRPDIRRRALRHLATADDGGWEETLVAQVGDPDPACRVAIARLLARIVSAATTAALSDLAADADSTVADAALASLGLRGDGAAEAELLQRFRRARGRARVRMALALDRLGVAGFRLAAEMQVGWRRAPIDLDREALRLVVGHPTPEGLAALYYRGLIPAGEPIRRGAETEAVFALDPTTARPLLARLLLSPEERIRQRAEERLRAAGLDDADLEALEALVPRALNELSLAFGQSLWSEAATAARELLAETRGRGAADWAFALDVLWYGLAAGETVDFGATPALPPDDPLAARLASLVDALASPPVITLTAAGDDGPLDAGLWCVVVRLRVAATGGALAGGVDVAAPTLVVDVRHADRQPPGDVGLYPIPPLGLLPGTDERLVLPVLLAERPAAPMIVQIVLVQGGKLLAGPVTLVRPPR